MSLEELKEYYNDRAIELLKQDNGLYDFTIETRDYNKIGKLLTITELNGFWARLGILPKKFTMTTLLVDGKVCQN